MSKILMISPKKCNDCKTCEAVCPNSAVNVIVFDQFTKAEISVPIMCVQCEDAACMKVCPKNAIYRDENGAVITDPDKCIGCKLCVSACSLGNIHFSDKESRIMKCNLCDGDPKCAKYCPSRAIEYVEGTTSNMNKKRVTASKFKELFEDEQE